MMELSSQGIETHELFVKLRDILASRRGTEVSINVKSNTAENAKKIQTFVSMTGCKAVIEKIDEHFIVHITGTPCCI